MPEIYCNTLTKCYPDGSRDILVFERDILRRPGWEERKQETKPLPEAYPYGPETLDQAERVYWYAEEEGKSMELPRANENLERSRRRARSVVRDLARSNSLDWFVTFTLDGAKIDRYDPVEITRKLNVWLDNHVRREGLAYVLVPELHKDGAVHFHGLINGALKMEDSGTMTMAGWKRPRRPRTKAQRCEWAAEGAQIVYNLPAWTYGFTTAIRLHGEREAAVGYVCKYISKSSDKVGGRWYYHGGDLREPERQYGRSPFDDAARIAEPFAVEGLGIRAVRYYVDSSGVIHAGRKGMEENGNGNHED